MKNCPRCGKFLSLGAFCKAKRGKFGRGSWCKICVKSMRNVYSMNYRRKRGSVILERQKLRGRQDRLATLNAYGTSCACCREHNEEFLAIDHIHGNGRQHRLSIKKNGGGFYVWLRHNGYPSGYRTLCHNCNWSYGIRGYCPHQIEKAICA